MKGLLPKSGTSRRVPPWNAWSVTSACLSRVVVPGAGQTARVGARAPIGEQDPPGVVVRAANGATVTHRKISSSMAVPAPQSLRAPAKVGTS